MLETGVDVVLLLLTSRIPVVKLTFNKLPPSDWRTAPAGVAAPLCQTSNALLLGIPPAPAVGLFKTK